jgi:hypothetical protein
MAWTYLSTAPGSSDKSYVRLRVGDTTSGDQLLQDEEILAVLDEETNVNKAASVCARTISAYFARRVDKTVGKLKIAMNQASEHYAALADSLAFEGGRKAAFWAGGVTLSDKEDTEADTDRWAPVFKMGQFDNVYASPSSSGD